MSRRRWLIGCQSMKRLLATALLAVLVGLPSACQSSPFAEDAARSQYDRYDELRGRGHTAKQADPYGRPQRDLQDRLGPLEPDD